MQKTLHFQVVLTFFTGSSHFIKCHFYTTFAASSKGWFPLGVDCRRSAKNFLFLNLVLCVELLFPVLILKIFRFF